MGITDRSDRIKVESRVRSLLVEAIVKYFLDRLDRLARIVTLGAHLELGADSRAEHHQSRHALRADVLLTFNDRDLRFVARSDLRERAGGAQMQTEAIFDLDVCFNRIHAHKNTESGEVGKRLARDCDALQRALRVSSASLAREIASANASHRCFSIAESRVDPIALRHARSETTAFAI